MEHGRGLHKLSRNFEVRAKKGEICLFPSEPNPPNFPGSAPSKSTFSLPPRHGANLCFCFSFFSCAHGARGEVRQGGIIAFFAHVRIHCHKKHVRRNSEATNHFECGTLVKTAVSTSCTSSLVAPYRWTTKVGFEGLLPAPKCAIRTHSLTALKILSTLPPGLA